MLHTQLFLLFVRVLILDFIMDGHLEERVCLFAFELVEVLVLEDQI